MNYRQIISYHPKFGHLYVPNQFVRMKYGNDSYFLETDERGFRNSKKSKKSKFKILLLGDSYAAGDGVRNEDRFSDLLGESLDVEIINLAVNGFGMDQQILVYEEFKNTIPHDAVLFIPHMDDFYRNLKSSRTGTDRHGAFIEIPKPYFGIENGSLKLNNSPVSKVRTTSKLKEFDSNESHIPTLLNEIKNKAKNFINRKSGKQVLGKISYPELNDRESAEWNLANLLIKRLIDLINDKPIFIAPIPYNYTIATQEPQFYNEIFKQYETEKVRFIDLLPGLSKSYSKNPEGFFLPLCGHFTKDAHQTTAEILSSEFEKNLNLSSRSPISENKSNDDFILGISCFYHDSAAALIKNGEIIAAAQEERFTRKKHDPAFPANAIHYCLEEGKIHINELRAVCYYDNPGLTLERVIHNAAILESEESQSFWNLAKKSMFQKLTLPYLLKSQFNYQGKVFNTEHHISHSASAFYPSPFESAAILVVDGVGEWACSTIAHGKDAEIKVIKQQHYPHSLGLLYSAFTYFCGFKVNSGEYKLMGLAPYGKPKYTELIKKKVVRIHEDGSITLNLKLFDFIKGEAMTNEHFERLFDGPKRATESQITQREKDLAASIQKVTEEIVLKMAAHAASVTGEKFLVLAGGVALNCVANGKLLRGKMFDDIWIQPAAGDAGGALGAALDYYFEKIHKGRTIPKVTRQTHAFLGPSFSKDEINAFLTTYDIKFHQFKSDREEMICDMLLKNKIIGYLDGRMEFGPRALAHRSIIGDPTQPEMQQKFNLKIKYRESFRPFAPIALEENLYEYFDIDRPSPFMLLVAPISKKLRKKTSTTGQSEDMIQIVNQIRSELPSITHVDYSARLQSVNDTDNANPSFHKLLQKVKEKNGYGVLINTSFNVRGEPIVCTPNDAYRCFMRTEMDVLVLGNYYLLKTEQPVWDEQENWQETFELD